MARKSGSGVLAASPLPGVPILSAGRASRVQSMRQRWLGVGWAMSRGSRRFPACLMSGRDTIPFPTREMRSIMTDGVTAWRLARTAG